MIRIGHIEYSNCIPVHALLLTQAPADVELVRGVPAQLNAALAAGAIDVAPCSSIEYARNAGRYRILPAHAIGSRGAVRSIRLETVCPLEALDGRVIAVPSASATSVVLLRVLLERRFGVCARLEWFDQARTADPIESGASAALRIGDIALAREVPAGRGAVDLGQLWTEWTGLPFAFAVWQVHASVSTLDLRRIVALLAASRQYFADNAPELAHRFAPELGLAPPLLLDYWASLHYDLDEDMQRGLLRFLQLAAELGEAPPTAGLDIVSLG